MTAEPAKTVDPGREPFDPAAFLAEMLFAGGASVNTPPNGEPRLRSFVQPDGDMILEADAGAIHDSTLMEEHLIRLRDRLRRVHGLLRRVRMRAQGYYLLLAVGAPLASMAGQSSALWEEGPAWMLQRLAAGDPVLMTALSSLLGGGALVALRRRAIPWMVGRLTGHVLDHLWRRRGIEPRKAALADDIAPEEALKSSRG